MRGGCPCLLIKDTPKENILGGGSKPTANIWQLETSGEIGPEHFPIQLSDTERSFLIMHLQGAQNYLEFGAGGSTYLALTQTNIPTIVSVETDENWIKHLQKWDVISKNNDRLKFMHIFIGKTGPWGYPLENDQKDLFPNFSTLPFQNQKKFDVIFIDARFRVACALQAILYQPKNVKILMHDFNSRPAYHCLLEFLDIVDTADTMCLFKIKDHYNVQKLLTLYEQYKYVCA